MALRRANARIAELEAELFASCSAARRWEGKLDAARKLIRELKAGKAIPLNAVANDTIESVSAEHAGGRPQKLVTDTTIALNVDASGTIENTSAERAGARPHKLVTDKSIALDAAATGTIKNVSAERAGPRPHKLVTDKSSALDADASGTIDSTSAECAGVPKLVTDKTIASNADASGTIENTSAERAGGQPQKRRCIAIQDNVVAVRRMRNGGLLFSTTGGPPGLPRVVPIG
jgi:hypothetical protein